MNEDWEELHRRDRNIIFKIMWYGKHKHMISFILKLLLGCVYPDFINILLLPNVILHHYLLYIDFIM